MKALQQVTLSLGLCLSLLPGLSQAETTTQTLIDDIITTYGGTEAWQKINGFEQHGRTYSERLQIFGKSERVYAHPNRMRIAIDYKEDEKELRQLDGDHGWSHGQAAHPAFVLAARLQAYRLALPLLLLDNKDKIEDLGQRDDEQGKPHRGLRLQLDGGLQVLMDINLESKHIVASWGMLDMEGQRLEFATRYSDLRPVDGKLMAFREEHYAMGGYIGYTELESIKFVEEFAAGTFAPAAE